MKQTLTKKLTLNKVTVADMAWMNEVKGGTDGAPVSTELTCPNACPPAPVDTVTVKI